VIALGLLFLRPEILGQEIAKYKVFLGMALLGLPTMILSGFFMQTLAAAQRPRLSSALMFITGAALSAASIGGIIIGGIFGLYVGTVVVGFVITIGTLIYLRKYLNLPLFNHAGNFFGELKRNPDMIPFAFTVYLGALTSSLSLLAVRYATLSNYGEASAGLLQAAIALALALGMTLNAANGLYLTPIMNRDIPKDEKIKAALEFEKKLAILLALAAMPMALFPDLMISILFSSEFVVVSKYVFLFVAAQCIFQISGVHQALLIGFDDLKAYSLFTCAGHISLGLIAWILVPSLGIFGAAIAFVSAYAVLFGTTLLRLRLKHNFLMPTSLTLLMIYSIAAILLAGSISTQYSAWSGITIVSKISAFLLFGFSLLFYLTKEERGHLYSLRNRIGSSRILRA
jgi:O-antigen/teichoic acid export membrane protein